MKTRLSTITATGCFAAGAVLAILGTLTYFEITKDIEEYPTTPRNVVGSAGPPYPSYDGAWFDFMISALFFTSGIVLLGIIRKRK